MLRSESGCSCIIEFLYTSISEITTPYQILHDSADKMFYLKYFGVLGLFFLLHSAQNLR